MNKHEALAYFSREGSTLNSLFQQSQCYFFYFTNEKSYSAEVIHKLTDQHKVIYRGGSNNKFIKAIKTLVTTYSLNTEAVASWAIDNSNYDLFDSLGVEFSHFQNRLLTSFILDKKFESIQRYSDQIVVYELSTDLINYAAQHNCLETVKILLDKGCKIKSNQALGYAIKNHNLKMVELFLSNGEVITLSHLNIAAETGHLEILKLLRANSEFTTTDVYAKKHMTGLMHRSRAGEVLNYLVSEHSKME